MKLRNLLEGLSDTLFHATYLDNAVEIISTNSFILSLSIDSVLRSRKEKKYYMSTARSQNSSYIRSILKIGGAVFELDGRKLSQNYYGTPVDFRSGVSHQERINKSLVNGKRNALSKDKFLYYFEHEDRLYSDKERIDDFGKYIKAVHIFTLKKSSDAISLPTLKKIKTSYPIYRYKKLEDILSLNTRKAEKLWS